jgi:hypothetical protein
MKKWLQNNKIFFETIAATLLSLMAIIISVVQINIAIKQNKLTEIQTELVQHQFAREERQARIEKTANWGELRNAMWSIFDLFPPTGTETIRSIPQEYQLLLFKKVRTILDSQIKNSVLIENKKCLGRWREAISGAKAMTDLLSRANTSDLQDIIVANATGVLKDVAYVWTEIILGSDEVSRVVF